jgi:hypothetical protein
MRRSDTKTVEATVSPATTVAAGDDCGFNSAGIVDFLIETRSLPALARRYHHDFAFYAWRAVALAKVGRLSHKLHFSFLLHPFVARASQSEQSLISRG